MIADTSVDDDTVVTAIITYLADHTNNAGEHRAPTAVEIKDGEDAVNLLFEIRPDAHEKLRLYIVSLFDPASD